MICKDEEFLTIPVKNARMAYECEEEHHRAEEELQNLPKDGGVEALNSVVVTFYLTEQPIVFCLIKQTRWRENAT